MDFGLLGASFDFIFAILLGLIASFTSLFRPTSPSFISVSTFSAS